MHLADRRMTEQFWKLPGNTQHFLPPKDSGVCNYVCLFQNFLWFILQRRSRKWEDLPRAKNRKRTLPTWAQGPGRNMWVLTQQSMFPLCQQCLPWPGTSCDMWASLKLFLSRGNDCLQEVISFPSTHPKMEKDKNTKTLVKNFKSYSLTVHLPWQVDDDVF